MRQVRLLISGDVQGVGFRTWLQNHAHKRAVTGWIKNRPDGAVEAVLLGKSEKISEMIEQAQLGPEISWVENVAVTDEEVLDEFADFEIIV